jgi:hypothetical protein
MPNDERISISFGDERVATALRVGPDESPARALAALDLPPFEGIVIAHGGAAGMEPHLVDAARQFVIAGLAPLAEQRRLLIVDGGTDIGTSKLMGDAREAINGTYPLLGVVPHRVVTYPGARDDLPGFQRRQQTLVRLIRFFRGTVPEAIRFPLNPSHTHFLLVDGDEFGDESLLLVGLLRASGKPGAALIINGGDMVLKEVRGHAGQGNALITLQGSGRVADKLADPESEERKQLAPSARLQVVDVDSPERCVAVLEALLAARARA